MRTAEPGLHSGVARGRGRAVAEDTELLRARCPQSPDRSVACPHPKARQDKSSVTTLALRMHEGGFGAEDGRATAT